MKPFHLLLWTACLALGACQDPEVVEFDAEPAPEPIECSEDRGATIFEERIAPLLADAHPASCGRCHLPGIDFRQFFMEDACASIACMQEEELVSLTYPEQSKLLDWVERGHEQAMRTLEEDPLVRAEHDALLTWIDYHARCNHEACPQEIENPCGKVITPPEQDMGLVDQDADMSTEDMSTLEDMHLEDMPTDADMMPDAMPDMPPEVYTCSQRDIERKFTNDVWIWNGRCYHCHSETYSERYNHSPKPAPWMSDDRTDSGGHLTARRLLESAYLDLEQPDQSLIILKPLNLLQGGVDHNGGSKISSKDDDLYIALVDWIEHVASCQTPP